VSHWTSGLPKLDIQPFDPTPLWDAAQTTTTERREVEARRRRMLPFVGMGVVALVAVALAGVLAFVV
jgi:hypothetical protein